MRNVHCQKTNISLCESYVKRCKFGTNQNIAKSINHYRFFKIGPLRNMIEHKLRTFCTCPPELPSTPIPNQILTQKENVPIVPRNLLLSKPPPPPPPPLPSLMQPKDTVQIPMRKPPTGRNSKKIKTSADSISLPRNFT